jgi:hypothetical protein
METMQLKSVSAFSSIRGNLLQLQKALLLQLGAIYQLVSSGLAWLTVCPSHFPVHIMQQQHNERK